MVTSQKYFSPELSLWIYLEAGYGAILICLKNWNSRMKAERETRMKFKLLGLFRIILAITVGGLITWAVPVLSFVTHLVASVVILMTLCTGKSWKWAKLPRRCLSFESRKQDRFNKIVYLIGKQEIWTNFMSCTEGFALYKTINNCINNLTVILFSLWWLPVFWMVSFNNNKKGY